MAILDKPFATSGAAGEGIELSIIIPARNEQAKIARDVAAAGDFLQQAGLAGEILVADDGSDDGTANAAWNAASCLPAGMVQVLRGEISRGKGHAVRRGISATRGRWVMFADSGTCVPFDNALAGLKLLQTGECELALGSRKLPGSDIVIPQIFSRRIFAGLFRWLIHRLLDLPRELTDTQCGFKLFNGDCARELFSRCQSDGFLFDLEIILLATHAGYRIKEFPVTWRCDRDSRISLTRTPLSVLRELWQLSRRMRSISFLQRQISHPKRQGSK
ncbi:MAG: glycosyltransferase [Calditrichaeota bacterium]|nr:glycosyltransferase [Calditrichota bacterium]